MLLQQEINQNQVNIQSYQAGEIKISGKKYHSLLVLQANKITLLEPTDSFAQFDFASFTTQLPKDIELILVGSGEKHLFMSPQNTGLFNQQKKAVEVMATRQACHTFQVLVHEKRKVLALLFL